MDLRSGLQVGFYVRKMAERCTLQEKTNLQNLKRQ
jgi:hypothetical protein